MYAIVSAAVDIKTGTKKIIPRMYSDKFCGLLGSPVGACCVMYRPEPVVLSSSVIQFALGKLKRIVGPNMGRVASFAEGFG
jgi:hypothetical protein